MECSFNAPTKGMITQLYRHFNKDDKLLYVGISLCAVHRLVTHRTESEWFEEITKITIESFNSSEDALKAEYEAIQKEFPIYNRKGNYRSPDAAAAAQAFHAREKLADRIVFKPAYKISEAAQTLDISEGGLRRLISERRIGCVTIGTRSQTRSPIIRITGWQIIDFLESLRSPFEDDDDEGEADSLNGR